MNMFTVKSLTSLIFLLMCFHLSANSTIESSIYKKLSTLNNLIKVAEKKNIDVNRELMTIDITKLFIDWATWDEDNIEINTQYYLDHPIYKKRAKQLAKILPEFQRSSLITLLNQSIEELNNVISGEVVRKAVPFINWDTVEIIDGQFIDKGKPVFLGSYTWKTDDEISNKYLGNLHSAFIAPSFIIDDKFNIDKNKYRKINNDNDKRIGQVFISHKTIPQWAFEKDLDLNVGSRLFSSFDIDNPLAKKVFSSLFENFIPILKDKRSSQLGYMLFNEPSFFTEADKWNTGGVSSHTKIKFRQWLTDKHKKINHLNNIWQSDFISFNVVDLEIPMQGDLRGSPIWFDWMRFNQHRVDQWFTFLDSEIKKQDPKAKTHIKLMPWLWNTDIRDHGLDFESLLEITDIIGFDANSEYSNFRGVQSYEAEYSFDWQSAVMSFDFFTSIQPNQILWDSENHFFNNVKFQERSIDPDYVRSIYWLASTHGLAGSSTWLWGRNPDGSIIHRKSTNSEFITEVTHQPIGFHALTRTLMDISAHGEDVQLLRKISKPIRIFYSETSAINQPDYMTNIRSIYKALYFEGVGLGFATQNIINNQKADWPVIVVTNTPNVTTAELKALNDYVNKGGTLVIDHKSLLLDEYNQKHIGKNFPAGKSVFILSDIDMITTHVKRVMKSKDKLPHVILTELDDLSSELTAKIDNEYHKTIAWRLVEKDDNSTIISIVNTGHDTKEFMLNFAQKNKSFNIINLLTGKEEKQRIKLDKRKTLFLKITQQRIE